MAKYWAVNCVHATVMSINPTASDAIVATAGGIDLSGGTVTFELSSADPSTTVEEIVSGGGVLDVVDVFESTEEVVVADFELTDPSGSISDEDLEQQVSVVSFGRSDCRRGGWRSLTTPDGMSFRNRAQCIRFVRTGGLAEFSRFECFRGGWRHLTRADGTSFRNRWQCVRYVRTGR